MKKEDLLAKLRKNTNKQYDMPNLDDIEGITYPNLLEAFIEGCKVAGADVIEVDKKDNLNNLIQITYPEAKVLASNIKGIKANLNPDTVEDASDLRGIDLSVIQGQVGVAENGCIWIPQTMKERALFFIPENIIILLEKSKLVNNMHEAYKRIQINDYGYGTFISGPSKTADIEQALVFGAQAAKELTVFLIG